ncbi:carboxypeptidase-like regulatory domain-containing protein [Aquimarina algiphila]|uniref:TonB-dependent receptor n=1 Tax=Aquimarina algiphila TaxID=2047982 RepID=A0A554VFC3_9FLAO|nr:carboxypeptidase-like regulatory domain-containing protein [Aquimarina algiphila]TSE05855.1 hypothetical protein FOF46_21290 [Aquimarina algiphila]
MKNSLLFKCITITVLMLLCYSTVFSQDGTLTGVLADNEGLPLPGVNIMIKGTNVGVQTDFDGNYSINCNVGDVLVFSYVGFSSKEVIVTAELLGQIETIAMTKKEAVLPMQSTAYSDAIQKKTNTRFNVPNFNESKYTFNQRGSYFQYNRIKGIDIEKENNKVDLTYFSPDIFYEVGWNSTTSLQFVKQNNLPNLQRTFSQGQPFNAESTFFGPESGVVFSYGPRLNSLQFDGIAYPFDQNGRLIPLSDTGGEKANDYDNSIFKTITKTSNSVFFNITTDKNFYGVTYRDKRNKDIFNTERSRFQEIELRHNNPKNSDKKVTWDTFIKYAKRIDNQPNLNGFLNTLLLNTWATPVSFENQQGSRLITDTQRSFSPEHFNNPLWLLKNNRNRSVNSMFSASIQNGFKLGEDTSLYTNINHSYVSNKQSFGLIPGTVGYNDGFSSDKAFDTNTFNAETTFKLNQYLDESDIDFTSKASYSYKGLRYNLSERSGFDPFSFQNPTDSNITTQKLTRNTLQLFNIISYTISDWDTTIKLSNTSYVSSIQNNKWFLPSIALETDLADLFDMNGVGEFKISTSADFSVKDTPLYYNNQSHNSLNITPLQSQGLIANNDLFVSDALQLEEKISYSITTQIRTDAFNKPINFGLTYYNNRIDESVFPVLEGEGFQLQNIADIRTYGFEANLEVFVNTYNDFSYAPGLVFSLYRNKVLKIQGNQERIPIAGFTTISKNLIKGQPAGVLVGTAYQRDAQDNVIIDDNGFPLIAQDLQVIGDPTPDFAIGFSNQFNWKRFKLNFLIDFQKGGDVWNGTQSALNYLGTSQQSAEEREITGFLFEGVNQLGQPNTITVDFANPSNTIAENRFVRYGFEGVGEEGIVDGSYLNLKSINLSYSIKKTDDRDFIREFDIGVYGNNLFTYSRFRGASPYSSLFDHTSGQGLQFFNTPIVSEIGIQIKIKL